MTRIAVLSTDPGVPWGGTKGASVHLERMARALADEGAKVLVLAAARAPGAADAQRGLEVRKLPGPPKGAPVRQRLRAESWRAAWLVQTLEASGADALYERFALHSRAGSQAARIVGIPHLVELNAPLRREAARYRRLDFPHAAARFEREVLARADVVLPVSKPLAEYARRLGARRAVVLPNAASVDEFAVAARKRGDTPVAVLAGNLRPWHGADVVAAAWRLLGSTAPELLVVGDGTGRAALEAVGAHVTGLVAHDRVTALLAACDIGLVPYARGAPAYFSPLKLFEYLAAGLAVVAADLPGVREIVDPSTAVLVPPGDPEALAHAVAGLAADEVSRDRLASAGRALVASRHTWRHRARTVVRLASRQVALEAPAP